MDSFWSQAFDDSKVEGANSNDGKIANDDDSVKMTFSAVPPRLQDAEKRLLQEKTSKTNRDRYVRAFAVALALGFAVVAILWMWAPAAMCAKKTKSYEVAAPSLAKIAFWGAIASVAGFAIGWNLNGTDSKEASD